MKNIKQLFCGIIIGAVATVSITAVAQYIVVPNSFPVKVNGQTVQVEGYNINDSTYFKLRDVADAVGGFDVDFVDGTIMVKAENAPTPTVAPTISPDISDTSVPNPMYIESETLGLVTNDEFQFNVGSPADETIVRDTIIAKANEIVGSEKFTHFAGDIVENDGASFPVVIPNISSDVPIEQYYQVLYPWLKSLQQ